MRTKKLITAIALLAGLLTAGSALASPAQTELKADGTTVIGGDVLAAPGTPQAAVAYAADLAGR